MRLRRRRRFTATPGKRGLLLDEFACDGWDTSRVAFALTTRSHRDVHTTLRDRRCLDGTETDASPMRDADGSEEAVAKSEVQVGFEVCAPEAGAHESLD